MLTTAVVILNYNGEKLLRQFLPSVVQHTANAEIYVADNASTDRSLTLLEEEFPTVRIIRLPVNYGFCKGYNESLKQITADIFVLLNSDVEVTEDWLAPIQRLMLHDPEIAAVQPKILSYRERNKFEYAGAGGGFIDALGYPFCRGRIMLDVEEDHGQYNDEREVFWASGACMAIRSDVFRTFGGFDEDFFAHMEEIDLCWKIHRTASKIFYTGKSTVYHLGAGTLGYNHPRKVFLNFRNNLRMLFKHYQTPEALWKFPLRFLLDWIAALSFLLKGHPENLIAVIRAHLAFLTDIRKNLANRMAIQKLYPEYSDKHIFKGSFILEYKLKGRKKFL